VQAACAAAEAQRLRSARDFAAAAEQLEDAIRLGDLTSRADLADMLSDGRKGVAQDQKKAIELVEKGMRLGCHHCQGLMAEMRSFCIGCSADPEQLLAMARASAAKGSKYGQRILGQWYLEGGPGEGGVQQDYAAALVQFRLAAAQGYDMAQNSVGYMFSNGCGVAQDRAEALRWFKLAAAQGLGHAMLHVGFYYENGLSVAADEAKAIRWYKRAAAAGRIEAAYELKRLGVFKR